MSKIQETARLRFYRKDKYTSSETYACNKTGHMEKNIPGMTF